MSSYCVLCIFVYYQHHQATDICGCRFAGEPLMHSIAKASLGAESGWLITTRWNRRRLQWRNLSVRTIFRSLAVIDVQRSVQFIFCPTKKYTKLQRERRKCNLVTVFRLIVGSLPNARLFCRGDLTNVEYAELPFISAVLVSNYTVRGVHEISNRKRTIFLLSNGSIVRCKKSKLEAILSIGSML